MCKYCDLKPTTDFMMKIGERIEEDDYTLSKIYVCQTEEGYYSLLYIDYEGYNHYIPIDHCPKCGKNLLIEDEVIKEYNFEVGV